MLPPQVVIIVTENVFFPVEKLSLYVRIRKTFMRYAINCTLSIDARPRTDHSSKYRGTGHKNCTHSSSDRN